MCDNSGSSADNDDHVAKTHCGDFVAAASARKHWEELFQSATREQANSPAGRWTPMMKRTVGKPEPRRSQERLGELGLASGGVPSTSDMKDVVQNLTDAEDTPRKVEWKGFPEADQQKDVLPQHGRLDDSVRCGHGDNGHLQRDGRSDGEADVGNALQQRGCDALLEVQAGQALSEANVGCRCRRGAAEIFVWNLGCAAESLVMNCWSGTKLEHSNVDGQMRARIGLINCRRSSEDVRTEER